MSLCQPNMSSFSLYHHLEVLIPPWRFFLASPGGPAFASNQIFFQDDSLGSRHQPMTSNKNPVPHQTLGQTNKPMY